MVSELQKQLREKSKELTRFKNVVKKEATPAKPKLADDAKWKMSCKELQDMSDFLQSELLKMGNFDKHFFWQEDWELLRLMWQEFSGTLGDRRERFVALTELWARVRRLGLNVCFKGWDDFQSYMAAA